MRRCGSRPRSAPDCRSIRISRAQRHARSSEFCLLRSSLPLRAHAGLDRTCATADDVTRRLPRDAGRLGDVRLLRDAHRLGARDHRRLAAAVAAANRSAGARRVVHRDGGAVREGGLSPLPGCARSRWPSRFAVPRCSDTGRDDLAAAVVARRLATLPRSPRRAPCARRPGAIPRHPVERRQRSARALDRPSWDPPRSHNHSRGFPELQAGPRALATVPRAKRRVARADGARRGEPVPRHATGGRARIPDDLHRPSRRDARNVADPSPA